ncbi:MAG TPA: hypothetical protein DCY20_11110 [Firmicutes bacterium]|nr:hypothetical protein [Bacillota bacterium]
MSSYALNEEHLNENETKESSVINVFTKVCKGKGLTANQLKWIAIITMFFDHFAASILTYFQSNASLSQTQFMWLELAVVILRTCGRVAFPIFAFLIVNGFFHTSNKKKYLLRLTLFAFISEPFFDFGLFNGWFVLNYQNVFFTLALGLGAIWCYDELKNKGVLLKIIGTFIVLGIGLFSSFLRTDYDIYGILIIFFMYLFFYDFKRLAISIVLLNLGIFYPYFFIWNNIPLYYGGLDFTATGGVVLQLLIYIMHNAQFLSVLALPILYHYNGEKGKQMNKYVFYAFYPIHIFFLGLLYQLIIYLQK